MCRCHTASRRPTRLRCMEWPWMKSRCSTKRSASMMYAPLPGTRYMLSVNSFEMCVVILLFMELICIDTLFLSLSIRLTANFFALSAAGHSSTQGGACICRAIGSRAPCSRKFTHWRMIIFVFFFLVLCSSLLSLRRCPPSLYL